MRDGGDFHFYKNRHIFMGAGLNEQGRRLNGYLPPLPRPPPSPVRKVHRIVILSESLQPGRVNNFYKRACRGCCRQTQSVIFLPHWECAAQDCCQERDVAQVGFVA
jgi:hypothetical protein